MPATGRRCCCRRIGASVVLCANLDRDAVDARIAAEGITRVL